MKITKYGHACLYVEEGNAKILVDPGAFSKGFEPLTGLTAILITHQHADHVQAESLSRLLEANPGAQLYTDQDTSKQLGEQAQISAHAMHDGQTIETAGVTIIVKGVNHAVIHPTIPVISNVGYLIASTLFVPGDNFTQPGEPIEVLALPIGAPWLKISEAIDYMIAVKPKLAIPIHDGVLAMPSMNHAIIQKCTKSSGIELRIIENGSSTQV